MKLNWFRYPKKSLQNHRHAARRYAKTVVGFMGNRPPQMERKITHCRY